MATSQRRAFGLDDDVIRIVTSPTLLRGPTRLATWPPDLGDRASHFEVTRQLWAVCGGSSFLAIFGDTTAGGSTRGTRIDANGAQLDVGGFSITAGNQPGVAVGAAPWGRSLVAYFGYDPPTFSTVAVGRFHDNALGSGTSGRSFECPEDGNGGAGGEGGISSGSAGGTSGAGAGGDPNPAEGGAAGQDSGGAAGAAPAGGGVPSEAGAHAGEGGGEPVAGAAPGGAGNAGGSMAAGSPSVAGNPSGSSAGSSNGGTATAGRSGTNANGASSGESGGCGCRAVGGRSTPPSRLLLGFALVAALSARRRRRGPARGRAHRGNRVCRAV